MTRLLRWLPLSLFLAVQALAAQERTSSPHGKLSVPCTTCHRADGWTPVRISQSFSHGKLGFTLQGAHATASCRACHQTLDFKGTPSTCVSCHKDVHRGELGADCATCHVPRSFLDRGTMIKAHRTTRFPLEGAHLAVDCTACHTPTGQGRQQFVSRGTECVSCHEQNFVAAKSPDHIAGGIPRTCVNCHSSTTWNRGRFNHDASSFPLTGAHRATACLQCHVGSRYKGTANQCAACHQTDYNQTTTPKHSTAGFGTDCVTCHATSSWTAAYDHSQTQFPLSGAHRAASCSQCHADGVYSGKPTTCVSCHQTDYNTTSNPKHTLPSYPTTCLSCHTTTTWVGATFDHNATQFPLTGAHRASTCTQCHADGVYAGKPTTCVSCHQTVYSATTNPKHTLPSYPTTCLSCHTTTTWVGATFDHNATLFPLTGAHRAATCNQCHADGVYAGKPTACASCHQTDYNAVVDPKHTLPSFPATCAQCHTTTVWIPSSFSHSTTTFPLTGAHITATCSSCHLNGVYKGTSATCVNCHQTDYNQTTNPNHAAAAFGTDCTSCHTTTTWIGATFNHDASFFPIYSGKHRNKWNTCTECHTNPSNYQVYTCLQCHEHSNKTKVDNDHQGENGYQYVSVECVRCHPSP